MFQRCLLALAILTIGSVQAQSGEVTIYSVYPGEQLAPIFAPFTQRTGIQVNFVTGTSQELTKRLADEGANTTADLHLDKDLVFHGVAQRMGLYRPFNSRVVESQVPSHLMEKNRFWTTVFYRARVIMYNTNVVKPSELSTYEALGNAQWKGRLCVRTSKNSYNEALGGYFVKHFGERRTAEILKSWVNNFSVNPLNGDRDVIQAVADGKCDVGIANTYYLPAFIRANAQFPVRPFFPNQKTTGAHVNGVGIAIVKHAKNVKEATMLLEYFTSREVQAPVAAAFSQYPVNPTAEMIDILKDFGRFAEDRTNVGEISHYAPTAVALFPLVNYK